ncbi:MAG: glycosyltransferase family 1 protein, partial [Candidatus Sumerlaeota bacterium]
MISKPFSILFAHNQYGRKSGEEHAIEEIIRILKQGGHQVDTFFKSSENIKGLSGEAKAVFSGIYNPFSKREMARRLAEKSYDLVQAQNLYPFLSPAVLGEVKKQNLPLLMRCPNYRLFCPNGLHLCRSQVCEKCLGFGKELWCLLKNCEENLPKSAGYA